ncbi:MAG: hypothetical protein AAF797_09505 [Planctomycetota bacterium]
MIRTATASALALALVASGSAVAGTHPLFVLENDGYTSFDAFNFTVTLDEAGNDWLAILNNDSTDGSMITGVYFERDTVSGQDWDWTQYGLNTTHADIDTFADDSSLTATGFTSLAGFIGLGAQGLDDATVSFDKHPDTDSILSDLDDTVDDFGYRIVYTVSDGENSAVLITGLGGHAATPTAPVAMPTPTAALAGIGQLGALVARRRRRVAD